MPYNRAHMGGYWKRREKGQKKGQRKGKSRGKEGGGDYPWR